MTTSLPQTEGVDPPAPLSVLGRFSITTLEQDMTEFVVVAAMPAAGMLNPFTGQPSVAALAVLVDDAAGRVNYYRRAQGRWTVSSELSMEISPCAIDHLAAAPQDPVVAHARPLGESGTTMLSVCTLTHRGAVVAGGTVRTVPVDGPGEPGPPREDPLVRTVHTTLAQLMAVEPIESGPIESEAGTYRLRQLPDPIVNNLLGIVHGGVSSAGLELVAAAALNHGQQIPMRTASLRVNFLRPFVAGADSIYEATPVRIGRSSAVADAAAIGADGRAAIIARVTAYR